MVEGNAPRARIYRYDPGPRAFSVVEYPGAPISTNGLAVDGEGRLLACERWNGGLARVSGGMRGIVADRSPSGARLNAPNDLTVREDGNIYFTDTTWGARPGEHAKTAVYRVSPAGQLSVAFETDMPNGVVLSPDGRTLYVGSDAHDRLWRLPVADDGSVGSAEPFADKHPSPASRLRVPDGLCVGLDLNVGPASRQRRSGLGERAASKVSHGSYSQRPALQNTPRGWGQATEPVSFGQELHFELAWP